MNKLFIFVKKRKIISGLIIIGLIVGGYFSYKAIIGDDSNSPTYVSSVVEKGTLVVSISGNGQIDVSDRFDIKPEVSGDIIGIYIKKDQEVKAGQLLMALDAKNAQQAVYDAEIALDDAKEELADLLSYPDAQSLRQAEVALAQAERDLNKAKETYENIETDAEDSLALAYEDGYTTISNNFIKLSDYMKDLKDVLGTGQSTQEYISGYELIIGRNSPFIQKLLDDFYKANGLFNKNHAFFITVFQDDDRDTINQLIEDTLETANVISIALDSARHMYDATVLNDYNKLIIASQVNKMKPKIESDASAISSIISSLRKIKDTIDDTIKNTPDEIEDAKWALQSAQEKFDDKKLVLEELMAGADPKNIRSQKNIVAKNEDALLVAKEKLDSYSIRASFSGVIAEVNDKIKKGDSVSSATIIATLMTKQYIAELTLNEIDIAKVKLNQPVTLMFDAVDGLTLTGKVTDIASTASTNQGLVTYGITITLDTMDDLIKPGMSVTAAIITEVKQDVLLVLNSAVKSQNGISFVEIPDEFDMLFAITNISGAVFKNPLIRQPVEIGTAGDEFTEIVSGLQEGDVIITRIIQSTAAQSAQTKQSSSVSIPGLNTGGMGGGQIRMR